MDRRNIQSKPAKIDIQIIFSAIIWLTCRKIRNEYCETASSNVGILVSTKNLYLENE